MMYHLKKGKIVGVASQSTKYLNTLIGTRPKKGQSSVQYMKKSYTNNKIISI